MVLRRIRHPDARRTEDAIAAGLDWTLGMQSRNGGWASFDTDNTLDVLNRIPFADMEAMIDPPTEDITGRMLELMGSYRLRRQRSAGGARHGVPAPDPRADGAWWGRWGVNYVYGTWSVLAGLRAHRRGSRRPARAARRGLGEVRAERRRRIRRRLPILRRPLARGPRTSTASQTAWGILALLAGEAEVEPRSRPRG